MRLNRRVFVQAGVAAGMAAARSTPHPRASTAPRVASPVPVTPTDEDGYDLWLRYRPVLDDHLLAHYRAATARIVRLSSGAVAQSITDELDRACRGMLNHSPTAAASVTANGTILIGTPDASRELQNAIDPLWLSALGDEGYVLRTTSINGYTTIVVAANHERGLLYGAFALIRQMQRHQRLDALDIVDAPRALANATNSPQKLRVTIDPLQAGWLANTAEKELPPYESGAISLSITPSLEPYLGPVIFACDPADLITLGFDTQIMIVTPAADHCTFALDVGSPPNTVVTGYRALTAADVWDGLSSIGWVGTPPRDTQLASTWDRLQDDCASDGVPRTVRLRLPPGKQRAWVLIGGQGSGTQPVRLTLGSDTLVQTGYIEESMFQWFGFTLDGGAQGRTVDLTVAGADGRYWRLAALVVLKPGL